MFNKMNIKKAFLLMIKIVRKLYYYYYYLKLPIW